jgi:hypothetical protein
LGAAGAAGGGGLGVEAQAARAADRATAAAADSRFGVFFIEADPVEREVRYGEQFSLVPRGHIHHAMI